MLGWEIEKEPLQIDRVLWGEPNGEDPDALDSNLDRLKFWEKTKSFPIEREETKCEDAGTPMLQRSVDMSSKPGCESMFPGH
jgi:hypothetical protein